jgi:hypothetical protein
MPRIHHWVPCLSFVWGLACSSTPASDPPSSPSATAESPADGSESAQETAQAAAETSAAEPSSSAEPSTTTVGLADDKTKLSGVLGDLGDAQPSLWTVFILNSNETIVYMSSSALTCAEIAGRDGSRWLLKTEVGSQVVEIVVPSASAKLGTVAVGGGKAEINYAPGGKSSANEKNASSGSVTFTKVESEAVLEGHFDATYDNPSGQVSGTFHADFCPDGQEF